jgi:hypothetical protein
MCSGYAPVLAHEGETKGLRENGLRSGGDRGVSGGRQLKAERPWLTKCQLTFIEYSIRMAHSGQVGVEILHPQKAQACLPQSGSGDRKALSVSKLVPEELAFAQTLGELSRASYYRATHYDRKGIRL